MAQQKTAEAKVTADHDEIREWVEARGGRPAAVAATHRKGDAGIIRLMFPDAPQAEDDKLEEISWEDFFAKFDEAGLALIYQEKTAKGQQSLFTKLVGRETAEARRHGEHHSARHKNQK